MTRKRKKQLIIISLILVIGIGLVAIFRKEKETRIISQDQIEAVEALTMEEKLEDFEYLYSFIEENYPLLKVKERVNEVNWLGEKESFKKSIENTSTDEMFMDELGKIIERLNDQHNNVIGMNTFKSYYAVYTDPKYEGKTQPWVEVLKDDNTIRRYRFDESQLRLVAPPTSDETKVSTTQYFKTDIIIPDEVAYLRIYRMNSDRIQEDGKIIRSFLKEIKDHNKLIIDIRGMGGWVGDDYYWIKNIIEPLANTDMSVDKYVLMKGNYGKPFYAQRGMDFSLISELSDDVLSSFVNELRSDYDYYHIQNKTISPVDSIGFKGEIYLLIDNKVIYAAENFAAFCKDSSFATLVGQTTSGMNYNFDTLLFSLPNSGIVVEMRGLISLNNDGTIREEVNIVPHIEVDATIGTTYERDKAIQYIINN